MAQDLASPSSAEFTFNDQKISITRNVDHVPPQLAGLSNQTTDCNAQCLGPVVLATGVQPMGERDVLSFLLQHVAQNTGLLVDARMPKTRNIGYIPGSVSLPSRTMDPTSGFRDEVLVALGAQPLGETLGFENARHLLIYDGGPATNDAGVLVQHLLDAGYPADKVSYYRGGILMWAALGFSIEEGADS